MISPASGAAHPRTSRRSRQRRTGPDGALPSWRGSGARDAMPSRNARPASHSASLPRCPSTRTRSDRSPEPMSVAAGVSVHRRAGRDAELPPACLAVPEPGLWHVERVANPHRSGSTWDRSAIVPSQTMPVRHPRRGTSRRRRAATGSCFVLNVVARLVNSRVPLCYIFNVLRSADLSNVTKVLKRHDS